MNWHLRTLHKSTTTVVTCEDKSVRYHGVVHPSSYFPDLWTGTIFRTGKESVEFKVRHPDRDAALSEVKRRVLEINADPTSAMFHRS